MSLLIHVVIVQIGFYHIGKHYMITREHFFNRTSAFFSLTPLWVSTKLFEDISSVWTDQIKDFTASFWHRRLISNIYWAEIKRSYVVLKKILSIITSTSLFLDKNEIFSSKCFFWGSGGGALNLPACAPKWNTKKINFHRFNNICGGKTKRTDPDKNPAVVAQWRH